MTNIEYGNEIRNALVKSRKDAQKTQAEVAHLLGVEESTIQNWESGRHIPNSLMLLKWFRLLHLPTSPYLDNKKDLFYEQYMALPEEIRHFVKIAIENYVEERKFKK